MSEVENKNSNISGLRVLLVEDNLADRQLIKSILKKMGIVQIEEVDGGRGASIQIQNSILNDNIFNLIITDWSMPQGSGLDLISQIRLEKKLTHTAVVLVTSVPAGAKAGVGLKIGVDELIVKPIQISEFAMKIEKLIQKLVQS